MLLAMTCPRVDGGYLAEELVKDQTLENLELFSERLALADKFVNAKGSAKERAKIKFFAAQKKAKEMRFEDHP